MCVPAGKKFQIITGWNLPGDRRPGSLWIGEDPVGSISCFESDGARVRGVEARVVVLLDISWKIWINKTVISRQDLRK